VTTFSLFKSSAGLIPSDEVSKDWFNKLTLGQIVTADYKVMRNGKFHRKFFAMLHVAFDNHEWPEIETQWGLARVNFEVFRKYVTVKAGYYEPELTPDGKVRVKPTSIMFSRMDEAEFSRLYSDVLDVILAEFLTNWKEGDMDYAVNQMMSFA
jgi:hypothetical protein